MAMGKHPEPLEVRSRPESSTPAKATVVLLHGWGADAQNMLDSVSGIFPDEYRLVSIQAPMKAPEGGFMWYQMTAEGPLPGTLVDALLRLETTLDPDAKRVPRDSPVFLIGFSQGGTMALSFATLRFNWVGGVVSMSGSLLDDRTLPGPLGSLKGMPILIVHGKRDNVRQSGVAREATRRLKEAGANVQFYEHDEGHTVTPEAWASVIQWLSSVTGAH